MEHVIVGGGVAGTAAAEQIRKHDPGAVLTLITTEPYPLYSRVLLPEYLAGTMKESRLFIRKPEWYEQQRIHLRSGVSVESVKPAESRVLTSAGDSVGFDRLLLATGGVSFVPQVPGKEYKGVFTLRTLDDTKAIMAYIRHHKRTVVLGGGVLGLEAGYGLLRAGNEVSVVEYFPRLLPRQMDVQGAALLQRTLERMGFRFHLHASARQIMGSGQVEGLLLEDGTRIECDSILISAGVRPNRRLADQLGLPIDKGVSVNDRMETVIPKIYAAGDLVEHRKVYYGLWGAAQRQGEVAGVNMAGGNAVYAGTTISNQLKVAGVDLLAAGNIDPEDQMDSIVLKDDDASVYKKIVVRDGKIVGTILYGDVTDRAKLLKAIEQETPIGHMKERLSRWDLSRL